MPIQYWSHDCRGTGVLAGAQLCTTCGVLGEFDGWHLSGMESMACYQYVYGIKPLGPHREMADRLFDGMRTGCERCSRRGLLNGEGGASWRVCPVCEGTGEHWNRPLDEVDAALAHVLEEFPDAEAPKGTINFMSSALIHDLGNNVMIDAAPERRPVYGTRPSQVPDKDVQTAWDRIFNDGVPDVEDSPEHLTDLPKDGKRVNEPTDSCFQVGGHTLGGSLAAECMRITLSRDRCSGRASCPARPAAANAGSAMSLLPRPLRRRKPSGGIGSSRVMAIAGGSPSTVVTPGV